jgi:hypothetical protein
LFFLKRNFNRSSCHLAASSSLPQIHSDTVPGGQEVEEGLLFNSYNRKFLKKKSVDMNNISEVISEVKWG